MMIVNLGMLIVFTVALVVIALARRASCPRMTRLQMALAAVAVMWIIISYTLIILDVPQFAFYSLIPVGTSVLSWAAVVLAPEIEPRLDEANKRCRS
jgi:hypothetical protein